MKVDVTKHRAPRTKVDITLVRAKSAHPYTIKLPVRPAAQERPEEESGRVRYLSGVIDEERRRLLSDDEADLSWVTEEYAQGSEDAICIPETDEEPCPLCSGREDSSQEPPKEDVAPEPSPDEEELLALIAEEEAEMEAARRQAEQPTEAAAEDEASAPKTITDANYMRYIDRGTNGEKVEVERSHATGKEIICLNAESGKLSRICGFIKNESTQDDADSEED